MVPSTIQQPAFKCIFPTTNVDVISTPPRLSSPQRAGKRGLCMPCSLDQMLQFTPIKGGRFKSPDWVSIPLLVIAHSIFKFQQPLCESGKQAVLISERQAFLGSAAGVSASGLMLNWLTGQ